MNPKNLNLYIVENDEPVRRSLGSLLLARLTDCSIKTFESGEAFLEGANLDGSGVVLLDLRMEPGMSGLEVFAVLKERSSPLVVVFLSGHGTLPVAVRAIQDGAVTWLEKPCTDEQLMEAVEIAKARARSRGHVIEVVAVIAVAVSANILHTSHTHNPEKCSTMRSETRPAGGHSIYGKKHTNSSLLIAT